MTSGFVPLHLHSHYSLLDGLSRPEQIAGRLVECGYPGSAITDHGSISGCAALAKAMKETCRCGHAKRTHSATRCVTAGCTCGGFSKADLKPVMGSEFYLCRDDSTVREVKNRRLSHLCVLARDEQGWKNLIRASSSSHKPENFYYRPRLDLERLAAFGGGHFIAFSGHVGSEMADVVFGDRHREAYRAETYDAARDLVRPDWERAVSEAACRYRDLFGRDNFWLEVQLIDAENIPASMIVGRVLRHVGKKLGIPRVATADSHYPRPDDARDHRVLLCAALKQQLGPATRAAQDGEDVTLGGFFRSERYHIPSADDMTAEFRAGEEAERHTADELAASRDIFEVCEDYDVLGKPMLPEFPCPDGLTGDQYLRRLCEDGFRAKVEGRLRGGKVLCHGTGGSYELSAYRERLEEELAVIFEAGLSGYFLVVQDYCSFARGRGKVGKGRGSGAGCLASYLVGITDVDPVEYNLLFERFYNAGRNSPGRVALPDIDTDFEKYKREGVIRYCRGKYGDARVAQMATFTRMQGRGALTDVLRAHGVDFEECKRITEYVPDEASISDQLQEMVEETGESSIIRWALENEAGGLKQWCSLREDGTLDGERAQEFAQSMRLEGTIRSAGRHPSGVIIAGVDLADVVPMSWDKSTEEMIVAVDMRDAEAMGLTKFDILGTVVLDRLSAAASIVRTGAAKDVP